MDEKDTGKFKRFLWKLKLWYMDHQWRMSGSYLNELFPPSFYYTHTEEEIKRITKETVDSILALINEEDD